MNGHEKALAAAMEPLLDEIFTLAAKVSDIQLTPGPKGDAGKDASIEEVVERLLSEHGEVLRGSKGEDADPELVALFLVENHADALRGKEGSSPTADAVAAVLAEKYHDQLRGEDGSDGYSPDVDLVAERLVKEYSDQLKGTDGRDGADGSNGADGKDGLDAVVDYDALALKVFTEYGEELRGKDAAEVEVDVEAVANALKEDPHFMTTARGFNGDQGVPGEKGADGADGRDGVDAPIIEPRYFIQEDERIERGEVVYWRGGLFQAVKNSLGTPDQDPNAYREVLNGVDELETVFDPVERTLSWQTRTSNGDQYKKSFPDVPRLRSADDGMGSIRGDLRLMGTKLESYDGEQWQEAADLKGETGADGTRGRKGMPGVGIKDITQEDELLLIELTDGEVKHFAINIPVPEFPKVEREIKRHAGAWVNNRKFMGGDVVTAPNGLYLALRDNSDPVDVSASWLNLLPAQPAATTVIPASDPSATEKHEFLEFEKGQRVVVKLDWENYSLYRFRYRSFGTGLNLGFGEGNFEATCILTSTQDGAHGVKMHIAPGAVEELFPGEEGIKLDVDFELGNRVHNFIEYPFRAVTRLGDDIATLEGLADWDGVDEVIFEADEHGSAMVEVYGVKK